MLGNRIPVSLEPPVHLFNCFSVLFDMVDEMVFKPIKLRKGRDRVSSETCLGEVISTFLGAPPIPVTLGRLTVLYYMD